MRRHLPLTGLAIAVGVAGCGGGGGGGKDAPAAATVPAATTPAAPATAGRAPTATDAAAAPKLTREAEERALAALAAKGRTVYCGGTRKGMVALTFDDGPGPYTHYVLKRLRRNRLRATFFLVSRNLPLYGDLVPKELDFGTVANHTKTHPNLAALPAAAVEAEMTDAQQAIAKASGREVQVFRSPYGQRTPTVDALARKHGMVQVLWSVDSGDSAGENYAGIQRIVLAGLRPGAIILMHDNRGQTVRALPKILHAIKRRGLRAVTLQEMLTVDPPTDAQLAAGRHGCGLGGAEQLGTG